MTRIKYRVEQRGTTWWILGDEDFGPYGPYKTRKEANSDRRGLQCAEDHADDWRYFVSEPPTVNKENKR